MIVRRSHWLALVLIATLLLVAPLELSAEEPTFEAWPTLRASEVLTPEERKGPHHTVAEKVVVDDHLMQFRMETPYGTFEPRSRRVLQIRIHEITAIRKLLQTSSSKELMRGIEKRVLQTPKNVVKSIRDPYGAVKRTPKGMFDKTIGKVTPLFDGSAGESRYADQWLDDAVYGEQKREICAELGIDPYTTNPKIRSLLKQLAQARAAGTWSFDIGSGGLPDAMGYAGAALDFQREVAEAVTSLAPDKLDKKNESRLRKMGVPAYAVRPFMANQWLSPTHKTLITAAVARLEGVSRPEALLFAAAQAQDEERAWFHIQQAVMVAAYHKERRKITRLEVIGNVTPAFTEDGHVVVFLPVDRGVLTQPVHDAVRAIAGQPEIRTATSRTLYVTGRLSERLKAHVEAQDFRVFMDVTPPK